MEELWMIGGDDRSRWAAECFRQNGFAVRTYGVPQLEDSLLPEWFGRLILPFPSCCGELVRGTELPAEELLARTDGNTCVFGAQLGIWKHGFESRGAQVSDLYGSEPLTTQNAVITAEGAIEQAMRHSEVTLQGANCLVIGYGRIGKVLAQKLQALQAHVTVSARKAGDRALIEAFGMASEETGAYCALERYVFVFNTVPAEVLSEGQLRQLSENCVLIELAAAPYGCSPELCQALGVHYCLAAGLPGRCAPKAAGIRYAQSILRAL